MILSCLRGSDDELTDGRTDIGDCRVASASSFIDKIHCTYVLCFVLITLKLIKQKF